MNGIKRSKFRRLTGIAVATLMCLSMMVPAMAEEQPYVGPEGSSALNQAQSVITKKLDMHKDVTTPTATYTFTFTPKTIDGEDYDPIEKNMPPVGPITVSFSALDDADDNVKKHFEGDTKSVIKETPKITATTIWPDVGIYVYEVHEEDGGVTLVGLPEKTGYKNSEARYKFEFWVDRDSTGALYVKYVNVLTIEKYIDVFYPGHEGGEKVDPTPDRWDKELQQDIEDAFSGVIFTNDYWKSDGGGTEKPGEAPFKLSKDITGLGSDTMKDVYFKFVITATKPSMVPDTPTVFYKAYVLDADGEVVKTNANHPDTDSEGYFTVESGTEFEVDLKHGETLVFIDLHVGTLVEVEEQYNKDFIPTYKHNFSGSDETFKATEAIAWGFPRETGATNDDPGPHYIKENNVNKAEFLNYRINATPTGLDVDDLPYVVLISLAIAGLVGFALVKLRKRTSTDS